MKILKLKLRGAIGIRKGLGVEEVEIDFSQYQPGLIALTGRNGSGKTTVMENLHPYRMMVSRDGSLQSHFYLKDSYRILHFVQNDKEYKSKILIDALTGASEAYLLNETDKTAMNDGKLTTYDEAIENLLGSPDLFFNSVFSGQKSKGIAELKPADRRKLFYELLNLDIYEQYLEKAKAEAKAFELKLSSIEGEISALQNNQPLLEDLQKEKEDLVKNEEKLVDEITKAEKEIEFINSEIKRTEVNIRLGEQKLQQNEEIEKKLKQTEADIQTHTNDHNSKVSRYNSDIEDAKKLTERNNKLLLNKETITNSLKQIDEKEKETSVLIESRGNLNKEFSVYQTGHQTEVETLHHYEKNYNSNRTELQSLVHSYNEKKNELEHIQKNAGLIDEVPCTDEVGKGCQFLISAYEGKEQLASLVAELNVLSNKIEVVREELDKKGEWLAIEKGKLVMNYDATFSGYNTSLKAIESHISKCQEELNKLKSNDWKKMLEEANEAENNNKILQEKISSINKMITEAKENFDRELTRLAAEVWELTGKIDPELEEKIQTSRHELALKNLDLDYQNDKLKINNKYLGEYNKELASIDQQIETVKDNESKIEKLKDEKIKAEREILEWNFLCKAFDKTGIPVLKLENSGIEITSIANELLSIFENKFRIVFETTKLKADKKSYKESFDINIVEEEGVTEISNKSGGEKVWVETALRLAISLLVRQQGKNIQTSFLDEADGALSLDNAYLYLEMLKNAHTRSGVHNTFIITHRTELIDLLPQRISLSDGFLKCEMN